MNHSEVLKWLLWGSPPTGGLALHWLLQRRGTAAPAAPPRPFIATRVLRWSLQVATSAGNLTYTRQLLNNAKTALAAQALDLAAAQAEADRQRARAARAEADLASCLGLEPGSTPAPGASPGAKPRMSSLRASRRRSRASPDGSKPATSSPTDCAAPAAERTPDEPRAQS